MSETPEAVRLRELEMKNAYQEAAIQDLSARVYEQQRQIDSLESQLLNLAEKVKSLASGENSPLPEGERPPHY